MNYLYTQFNNVTHSYIFTNNENDFESHSHTSYELLYVVKGAGTFIVGDRSYEFSDGTLFFIPPGVYHVLQTSRKSTYERHIINFAPELMPPLQINSEIVMKANDDILSAYEKICRYAHTCDEKVYYVLLCSLVNEIVIALSVHSPTTNKSEKLPLIVSNAINFISEHIHDNLTADSIAKALFVSKSYLCHLFINTMKTGIMRYVRTRKMYVARDYIQRGYSVIETAQLLGYESYPTFLRNYKSEFSITPSAQKQL
jgi:AraC-like DNA-binding protein